jgi:hypothetical protein
MVLTACPLVKRLTEQPLKIWYHFDKSKPTNSVQLIDPPIPEPKRSGGQPSVTYTIPDFLVEMCDGDHLLIEVKPRRRVLHPRVQRHSEAARMYCGQQGWTWRLLTDHDLFCEPLMSNLRRLVRYRAMTIRETSRRKILGGSSDGMTIRELMSQESADVNRWHDILHLIAVGELTFDLMTRELNRDTALFRDQPILWNPFASVWAEQ